MTNTALIGELLDYLVGLDRPASTSQLSTALTTTMRRLVGRRVVTDEDVMTWNALGYWEVTGATISTILAKQPDVVMTGIARKGGHGRNEKHWALRANVERWDRHREAREVAATAADTRFQIHEGGVQGKIRIMDNHRVGRVNTVDETVVFMVDTNAVPIDVARDLAARAKRALVRSAVLGTSVEEHTR